ncbi:F-box only protein 7-like [Ptychodera flava]|uniref:F-box only protein 7-like n=1 Tax=Ptychodera flava TaxID=63121 RepID=UPI00396A7E65
MRLRVRLGSRTENVIIEDDQHLLNFIGTVATTFGLEAGTFVVTLNGRDALTGDENTTLKDLDIVSGDLIRIAVKDEESLATSSQDLQKPPEERHNLRAKSCEKDRKSETGSVQMCKDESKSEGRNMQPDIHQSEAYLEQVVMETEMKLSEKIFEPMLCREATDTTVPFRLEKLFTDNNPINTNEALCIVLHVLMLESGFQSIIKRADQPSTSKASDDNVAHQMDNSEELVAHEEFVVMPADWRNPMDTYSLKYTHAACEGAVCNITCVPIGHHLFIHGKIQNCKGTQCQLKLRPADYVRLSPNHNAVETYNQLSHLSRVFKDSISYSLLAAMRTEVGQPPLHGLLALMAEIQLKILNLLDVKSLVAVSCVCRHLHVLANDSALWRLLYLRDFGKCNTSTSETNWKKLYIMKYTQMMESRRRILQPQPLLPHPHGVFPSFHPPIPPMCPPGFRGGDYDRDPFAVNPFNRYQPPDLPRIPGPRFDPLNPLPNQPLVPGHRSGGIQNSRGNPTFPNPRRPQMFGRGGGLGGFF